jgi:hypothetical protein
MMFLPLTIGVSLFDLFQMLIAAKTSKINSRAEIKGKQKMAG